MYRQTRIWHGAALVALAVVTLTAPAARAADGPAATLAGGGSTSLADVDEGPVCSPDIGWSISTPTPGGERAVIRINYWGSVGCNFYLAGAGQAFLWDRSNGVPDQDRVVSQGNIFSFGEGTGGTSSGSASVDGRVNPGLRKAEVGFALALRTLDGTPWGPCGQLPYPWHYVSECEGVGTDTLSVTIGSGVFDTGLAPYTALPVPKSALPVSEYDDPHHDYPAIDLPVGIGTPVYAVRAGTISYTSSDTGLCGRGVYIRADDVYYLYCHLSSRSVAAGAQVLAGDQIGLSGNTGGVPAHLHFEIRTGRGTGTRYCPQDMLLSIYNNGISVQPPQFLPTTGCFYQSNTRVSLNKSSFQVGEVPVYSVSGAEPNSAIYWSSTLNGVTVEDGVFYGQYTDANGNWSGSGSAWTGSQVGTWTKTIEVYGGTASSQFTVANPAPPPPSARLAIDKTSYVTGESPLYAVTNAVPSSPIYWSSTRNGAPTGEDNAFYGHYTDTNGNWSGGGAAWTNADAGSWTKTINVGGQTSAVAFQVTAPSPPPSSLVLRSSANLMYVSAELGYGGDRYGELRARAAAQGPWEQWTVEPLNATDVALRSNANGLYVSAELGYGGDRYATLRARAYAVGPWEVFRLVSLSADTYAIVSVANGLYVSAELNYSGDRYATLRARAYAIGPWEVFTTSTAAPPPPPPPPCEAPYLCDY